MSPRGKTATGIEPWDESIFSCRSSQHVTVPSLEKEKQESKVEYLSGLWLEILTITSLIFILY